MVKTGTNALEATGMAKAAAVRMIAAWIILPLFFLATGGSLGWWEAWAYCAVLLCPMTIFMVHILRHDPEFIARRFKYRETQRAQRRIVAWGLPLFLATLVIPGLDHRFGWSAPPAGAVLVALAIVLASYLAVLRVFVENRWAGRTIETYPDQQVVSTGPYAIVRHPMYAAAISLYLATPVALGSWWGLLPALPYVWIFTLRIRSEEEILLRDLPGYDEYRQKVRYRVVPFVW